MTNIQWTDETWNPTTGCNKVSPGCRGCYAEKMHKRLMGIFPEKYTKPFSEGVEVHEDDLLKPFKWKKSKMIFVNSMSDLFHDDVSFNFIDKVFDVMKHCPQHTFQILTKRPMRMMDYLCKGKVVVLPNVLVGTSCEDQDNYNARVPALHFIKQNGWRTMLSLEPLLGPINMLIQKDDILNGRFDWIITGGESGHNARPMHPDWVRSIRDQCHSANVPFFFKQWGEWKPDILIRNNEDMQNVFDAAEPVKPVQIINDSGKHNSRIYIEGINETHIRVVKLGKSKSGAMLDGVQHLNFPQP